MKTFLNKAVLLSSFTLVGSTLMVTAQGASSVQEGFGTLTKLIDSFSQTVLVAFGSLLMAGAVVIFFMGIVQYIWGLRQGDSGKAKTGSNFMLWGLLGLFVMFSVYGIVKLAQGIFFNNTDVTTITVPRIKFDTTGAGTPLQEVSCAVIGAVCSLRNGQQGTCKNNKCSL